MSHNPHSNHLFTGTECLSEQQMLDYIDNKLSLQERHVVEKHVLDCELCADAIEGFTLITDRGKLDEVAFAVNAIVTSQEKEQKKSSWLSTPMKIAATITVLLLIGSVTLYLKNSVQKETDKTFASNFKPYPGKETGNANPGTEKSVPQKEEAQTGTIESLAQNTKAPGVNENTLERSDVSDKQLASRLEQKPASPFTVADETGKKILAPKEEAPVADDLVKYKQLETDMDAKDEEVNMSLNKNTVAGNTSNNNNIDNANIYYRSTADSTVTISSTTSTAPTQSQGITFTQNNTPAYIKLSELAKPKVKGESLALKKSSKQKQSTAVPTTEEPAPNDYAVNQQKEQKSQSGEAEYDKLETTATKAEEKTKTDKKDAAAPAPFTKGMEKYNAEKYSEALPFFEQTLAAEPSNADALFYSAVCYLSINQPDKAITNLDKVLALNKASYTDPAKWYKALAYIKKGDKKSATPLLEQLQKGNSTYKQKAANTLKDIR